MTRIIATVFLCLAFLFGSAAVSKADDPFMHDAARFCRLMDLDSSPLGVYAIVTQMVEAGVPEQTAIDTINYALVNMCPEHIDAFMIAAAIFGDKKMAT